MQGLRLALAAAVICVLGVGMAQADDGAPFVPESARAEAGHHGDRARLRARLLVDAGRSTLDEARIGVLFDLDPGWHLYWRNSGDTGIATRLEIESPGAVVGEIDWPTPSAFNEAEGTFVTYGYAGRVLLMSDLSLDPAFERERVLSVEAKLLICEDVCIPAGVSLTRSLTEALIDSPDNPATTRLFEEFEAKLPVDPASLDLEVEALYSQSAVRPGDSFEAAIAVRSCVSDAACIRWQPGPAGAAFFPISDSEVLLREHGPIRAGADPATSILGLVGEVEESPEAPPERLRGVLSLRSADGAAAAIQIDLPLPFAEAGTEITVLGKHWLNSAATAAGYTPSSMPGGLFQAILLALLGGLILNLMPCVLPVLAIKVFAVAEMAGRSRRELIANGAAYAIGILSSMAVLAGVVLGLHSIGAQVGWGFQFQSPLFISVIAVVLVAFAMNLFGVFEITVDVGRAAQVGTGSHGMRRSFFEGLLAVVLATPCSAPFLGTAVGFAFASSPIVIIAIFLAIGAGLALPFVLITLIPGLARFVPKAGPWMLKLRGGLGFALLATVVWLLWLTGGVSGVEGLMSLLLLLLVIAFGLFVYGGLQSSERRWTRVAVGISLVVLTGFGLNVVRTRLAPHDGARPVDSVSTSEHWEPWTPAAIDAALEAGSPVLVVFSAEWCITCKVNERVVLRSSRVEAEFERLGVRVFKADWTRRDDTIRAELARFGRAGVPLYLVYDPKNPDSPAILPELLSVGDIVDSLRATTTRPESGAAS